MIDPLSSQPFGGPRPPITPLPTEPDRLQEAARRFEANFLAEMLRATNLGRTPETFGGGPGEEHFSTMLVQSYADRIAEAGGIGLADHVHRALIGRR